MHRREERRGVREAGGSTAGGSLMDRLAAYIAWIRETDALPPEAEAFHGVRREVFGSRPPRRGRTALCSCGVVFRPRCHGGGRWQRYHGLDCPDLPAAHRAGRGPTTRDDHGRFLS